MAFSKLQSHIKQLDRNNIFYSSLSGWLLDPANELGLDGELDPSDMNPWIRAECLKPQYPI